MQNSSRTCWRYVLSLVGLTLGACSPPQTRLVLEIVGLHTPATKAALLRTTVFSKRGRLAQQYSVSAEIPGALVVVVPDADDHYRVAISAQIEGATIDGYASVNAIRGESVGARVELDGELADYDADGVPDLIDNCATVPNPEQTASSDLSRGDACVDLPAPRVPSLVDRTAIFAGAPPHVPDNEPMDPNVPTDSTVPDPPVTPAADVEFLMARLMDPQVVVDRVGGGDGELEPNGTADHVIEVTLSTRVEIVAIALAVSNYEQWDTVTGDQMIFAAQGGWDGEPGSVTYGLGVEEGGVLLNDANGGLMAISPGQHTLTLYGDRVTPQSILRVALLSADGRVFHRADITAP